MGEHSEWSEPVTKTVAISVISGKMVWYGEEGTFRGNVILAQDIEGHKGKIGYYRVSKDLKTVLFVEGQVKGKGLI